MTGWIVVCLLFIALNNLCFVLPAKPAENAPISTDQNTRQKTLRKWPVRTKKPTPTTTTETTTLKSDDTSTVIWNSIASGVSLTDSNFDLESKGRAGSDAPLNICTWNVFRFGPKKFSDTADFLKNYRSSKIDMMVEQIQHADILALQEYFDASLVVLNTLRDALTKKTGSVWQFTVSPRVGRGSQEQYVFLYRTEVASVLKEQIYPEPSDVDQFSREPFFTKFKLKKGKVLQEIVLGTIHTEPDSAVEEINYLVDAFSWAEKYFSTQDVMILGDYNGDCQYVRKSDWNAVKLWTNKAFRWYIPTGVDTAAMTSQCTFDR